MTVEGDLRRVIEQEVRRHVRFRARPERLTGGFWAAIYAFELEPDPADREGRFSGPLVLRVMPEAAVASKEVIVQSALADCGYTTPRVVMSGSDDALGGSFMIMLRAPGRSPMSGLKIGPSPLGLMRSLRRIPVLLGEVAANLHSIDPNIVDAALGASAIELPVIGIGDGSYKRNIRSASDTSAEGFTELLGWFEQHAPTTPVRVVCHGDLHPLNLLVEQDGSVTVLDWTNANICPPELDVGFTSAFLRCAPIAVPNIVRPIVRRVTNRLATRFVDAYGQQPGARRLDPTGLRWFEALQYARCLAEVALGRTGASAIVGPTHPFETASRDMIRQLAALIGITVVLPART